MIFQGKSKEHLLIEKLSSHNCALLKERIESGLSIFWNLEGESLFEIDGQQKLLRAGEIIFLTEFHQLKVTKVGKGNLIRFNRSFYCIKDHDAEVSCKGLLFFGASQLPHIYLDEEHKETFEALWKVFESEMKSQDHLQFEMLQMLLKRMIILCTRIFRQQHLAPETEEGKVDVIRQFNYLVEVHFREYHSVTDYADLLHKSPKTLSNLFSKSQQKKPLELIHDRILLEANRLLSYSDKPVKEIAYELGYTDIQSFSRFFKSHSNISPKKYRDKRNREKLISSGEG
ncbi:MAG: helix-turn-helix transcriptional regulator [Bacteroidota bacterium]